MLEKPILQPMWLYHHPSCKRTPARPSLPSVFLISHHLGPRLVLFSLVPPMSAADGTVQGWGRAGARAADGAALQNVGCDYEIDSNAVEDRCGVCHGDGSTCHTVKKTFEDSEGLGKGARLPPQNTRCLFHSEPALLLLLIWSVVFNHNL